MMGTGRSDGKRPGGLPAPHGGRHARAMFEERFLRRAIALSCDAVDRPGTEPFAAVVVRGGIIVGEGLNHAAARFDPTSHGETEAIRDACRRLGTLSLAGCDLYTSCEPCALCVAAIHVVGIRQVFYAASLAASEAALTGLPRPGDIAALRAACAVPIGQGGVPARQALEAEALPALTAWAARQRRAAGG